MEDLLSLPKDEPLLIEAPKSLTFDGGGSELAELSLSVEAESLSPLDLTLGFRREELDPPLSESLPYSPSFLGGGSSDLAGDARLLLAFELKDSAPSDFLRGISASGRRL